MTKLRIAFRNFANAPKKVKFIILREGTLQLILPIKKGQNIIITIIIIAIIIIMS